MATDISAIGLRALNVAQIGLATTQHNISNVNTPGFHRQEITQSTLLATNVGSGWLGQGVKVDTIKRIYSEFLDNQVLSTAAESAYWDSYRFQASQIDNLLGDPNSGLSPSLQEFFSGVQAVASDPASVTARQSLLSSAESLVTRFESIFNRLNEIRAGVNTQLSTLTTEINAYSRQIASLNDKIALAQNAGSQPPNDLLDQRDQLIAELNERVKTTVSKQSDGSYNVFIGNGQALVVGAQAYQLGTVPSAEDPGRYDIAYQTSGGGQILLNPSDLTGGTLGGLLAFRQDVLDPAQNSLGRIALGLAQAVNSQHQLGLDLQGSPGGLFFNIGASSPTIQANTNNTGSGALSASLDPNNIAELTASNYRVTYNGPASYTVTDLTTNTSVTGDLLGDPVFAASALPGLTNLAISGTPNPGDSFFVAPTRNGGGDISVAITDVRQIAAAAPVSTSAGAANTGSATISAGSVNGSYLLTPLGAPATLTFSVGPPASFSVAPAASTPITVTSGGTTTTYTTSSFDYTSGATVTIDGVEFVISGSPSAGDTFTLAPNSGGVADGRNALLLGALQTTNLLAGNTASLSTAYAQLVGNVGAKAHEAQINSTAQLALLSQARQAQQEVSGVNLDEEAANLLRYQHAYQAAAKIIQTGSTLFETILNLR
jgi:flagellar hook-associated protein 1 FlgK